MPHFFKQVNSQDLESVKRTDQEIHAIVSYLFDRSESFKMEKMQIHIIASLITWLF